VWAEADLMGGSQGGACPIPHELGPQQVPGEAFWCLYNARKLLAAAGGAYSVPPDRFD